MAEIKVGTRKSVQLGQANPISGNTKWISNAMAAGRGAMEYGNQIMRTSQQVTSTVMSALEKGDKVNQLNEGQSNYDKWESGLLDGSSEYNNNSPMGVMTRASWGEINPDTGMLANDISPKMLPKTITDMYSQYEKDHIDTIQNSDVKSAMKKYHGAKFAHQMAKVQGHVVSYTQARQVNQFVASFDDQIDLIRTGNSDQIKASFEKLGNMMNQVEAGVFPSIGPSAVQQLDGMYEEAQGAFKGQLAYKLVTSDNVGFDHPADATTQAGVPVVTSLVDYDNAIAVAQGDFSMLDDPRYSEEKKQEIMAAVLALDENDPKIGTTGSARNLLIDRLRTDRAKRKENIDHQKETSFATQVQTLQDTYSKGKLTQKVLDSIITPHDSKSSAMYNQYKGMIKSGGEIKFSQGQIVDFRKIESEIRSGESDDPKIQSIIDGFVTNPTKANNAYLDYLVQKFGFVPESHWKKATVFLGKAGKDWKVSKMKQNAIKIAENSLILKLLKPDTHKALQEGGAMTIENIMDGLSGINETSVTEARRQIQSQMINFEEVLDETLKATKEAHGISFNDQLRAPLYMLDKDGAHKVIAGSANSNYIVDTLIQEQMGNVSSSLLTKMQNTIKQNQIDDVLEIQNAQKRIIYNTAALTEKLTNTLQTNSLLGKEVKINFADGSNFSFVAPEGMTTEDGKALYFSKIAMMQTGDPSKVVKLPADHPIPEGWPSRTEPWQELEKRKALVKSGALSEHLKHEDLATQEVADIANFTKDLEALNTELADVTAFLATGESKHSEVLQLKQADLEVEIANATLAISASELGLSVAQVKDMDVEVEKIKQQIATEEKALKEINAEMKVLDNAEKKAEIEANKSAFVKVMDVASNGVLKTGQFLANFVISDFYGMGADARHAEEWIGELKATHAQIEKTTDIDYSSYETWKVTGYEDWKIEEMPDRLGYNYAKEAHDEVIAREKRLVELLQGLYERRNYTSGDGVTYFESKTK